MKKMIETRLSQENGFTIFTEEYEETGLFFQPLIQSKEFSTDIDDIYYPYSLYEFAERCKKDKLYRLLHIILGNKDIIKNIDEYMDDYSLAGMMIKTLVFPVYFKRACRKLTANAISNDSEVVNIKSFGYELPNTNVSGYCCKENTIIKTKHGTRKLTYKGRYHYTYKHLVKEELIGSLQKA